jgi:hypothetical protein
MNKRRQIRAGFVALGVLITAIFGLVAVYPVWSGTATAATEAKAAVRENAAAEARVARLRAAATPERQAAYNALADFVRAKLPTTLDLAGFTRYLGSIAPAGLAVASVQIGSGQAVGSAVALPAAPDGQKAPALPAPPAGLFEYDVTIQVKGPLGAMKQYLASLQDGRSGRFVLIDQVTWSGEAGGDGGAGGTESSFTITGFTFALAAGAERAAAASDTARRDG